MNLRGCSRRRYGSGARSGLGTRQASGAVAEHGLEHEYLEVVQRAPPYALDCECKIDGRHRIVAAAHFGAHNVCPRAQRAHQHRLFGRHWQRGKVLSASWVRGVVHLSDTDGYHPVSGVVSLNVRLEIGSIARLDVLRGPRMVRPSGLPNRRLSGPRHVVE